MEGNGRSNQEGYSLVMSDVINIGSGGNRVRIEGLGQTMRALTKAGADAQDMKDLMHALGMLVVNAANPPVKSGALDATMRAGRGKTKAVVRAGGAKTPYAGVVHYGWPQHNIEAQPFLQTALDAQRTQIFDDLEDGIGELLRKANLK